MPELEKIFENLPESTNKDFRLWLTTESHEKFPAILLSTCYKVAYESPPGIKKNLERTYQNWSNDFIE